MRRETLLEGGKTAPRQCVFPQDNATGLVLHVILVVALNGHFYFVL